MTTGGVWGVEICPLRVVAKLKARWDMENRLMGKIEREKNILAQP